MRVTIPLVRIFMKMYTIITGYIFNKEIYDKLRILQIEIDLIINVIDEIKLKQKQHLKKLDVVVDVLEDLNKR